MRGVLKDLAAVLLVLSAMTVTGVSVKREFFPEASHPSVVDRKPVPVTDWNRIRSTGHHLGPEDPDLLFVVFSDFECAGCRIFEHDVLPFIEEEFGVTTALLFRHLPLPRHRFSYSSARAAECAGDQGRFREFHDAVFSKQDSLGVKPYGEFAIEAGVTDIDAFVICIEEKEPVPAIERDIAEAKRIGASGTPTVLVKGLMPPVLDSASIVQLVKTALRLAEPR